MATRIDRCTKAMANKAFEINVEAGTDNGQSRESYVAQYDKFYRALAEVADEELNRKPA
jgi:hypothetical protein